MKVFQGTRPDLTPAQVVATLIAGIPVIATLLHTFGVYDLSPEQQDALKEVIQWAGVIAVGLFGADAGLRAARNSADAKVQMAAVAVPSEPATMPAAEVKSPPASQLKDITGAQPDPEPGLPSDDEEFGSTGLITGGVGGEEQEVGVAPAIGEPGLPDDDEEFAEGGPDDDPGPESRLTPVPPEDET